MKTLLYRYIASSIHKPEQFITGHSAEWQSWCIYQIFKAMGFEIDMINWKSKYYDVGKTYDVIFDIVDLSQLVPAFREDTIKIFMLTGADNVWRNQQGEARVRFVNERRGCDLSYARRISDPYKTYRSIELADYVLLNGNHETLSTYPERYQDRIHLQDTIGSLL